MSKYKYNLRPAGMSDDETSSNDENYEPIVESSKSPEKKPTVEQRTSDCDFVNKEDDLHSRIAKACMTEDLDVIQEYLKQNDVNEFLCTGWTLLLYATSCLKLEMMEYLLTHGADPDKHKDGFTPLMALCSSTKVATEKSLKCLQLLIQFKANVNAISKRRETALMFACKMQNVEFITELLKHVDDINTCDSDGKTALFYAVAANNSDVVEVLLRHNADTSMTDKNDISVKDIACTKGFTKISILLGDNKDEVLTFCRSVSQRSTWKYLFPDLYPREDALDPDVMLLLYGMGLEKYDYLFEGMEMKTFLQLTEVDLCWLGVNISVHRSQFLENLEKFHKKKWHTNSLGIIKKSDPYTIYDGIMSLANAKKQIGVIAASFEYIKNNVLEAEYENILLRPEEKLMFAEELTKTQKTLQALKEEIMHMKKLSRKINKENDIGEPATFISHKNSKSGWPVVLSVALMIGLCLYKTSCIQRLWSNVRHSV